MEKHLPKIVGSWLAGTYDRDRVVSRAAIDGITSFLDNEKKIIMFWTRCQLQILVYAQEAINETPQTLSDERTMTAEDLQAKYFRVVGSSISLVVNLLVKLDPNEIAKNQDKYNEFLSNNQKLWTLAACQDSFVRRAVFQLLEVCLDKQHSIVEADLKIISHAFISEALRASQSSSALQLVQALINLTSRYPYAWTTAYKGKKAPLTRLRKFIESGSQGGPAAYWQSLKVLFEALPLEVLPVDVDLSLEFLVSFRNGIGNREEPRSNAQEAWNSYFETSMLLSVRFKESGVKGRLFQEALYPVFEQYLHPSTENAKWSVGNNGLSKAYKVCAASDDVELQKSFADEWERHGSEFIQRINTSLPEQSKDYHKSQSAVLSEGQ
jgi:hypothetical protein